MVNDSSDRSKSRFDHNDHLYVDDMISEEHESGCGVRITRKGNPSSGIQFIVHKDDPRQHDPKVCELELITPATVHDIVPTKAERRLSSGFVLPTQEEVKKAFEDGKLTEKEYERHKFKFALREGSPLSEWWRLDDLVDILTRTLKRCGCK